uniref:BZIP domain-containing protein n=1 Tax=Periophthalmus magnuspinnatus TaxID=409849 RepID=A0A3B4AZX4_9GOBI
MTAASQILFGDRSDVSDLLRCLAEHPFSFPSFEDNGKNKTLCFCCGGGGSGGVSASLTPAIWDKTIPYDGETFHLEYMDLDEFLLENGIPVSLEEDELQKTVSGGEGKGKTVPKSSQMQVIILFTESSPGDRNTPSPIDPDAIEVDINFQPDPTDLVLSSVPGGELFNPRKHRFSDEDLKPQPMIKKAKKVFVPDEQKDEKYWSRRKKNNLAAKRSRDARRLKENQITVRASFLERENAALRQQVAELRKDCGRCKNILARYEAKYGPL